MNLISGKSLIAGEWRSEREANQFFAFDPAKNQPLTQRFYNVSEQEIELACQSAAECFEQFATTSAQVRAKFLTTVAEQILALGEQLIEATHKETGLPIARLEGERGRTVNQLRAFANLLLNPIESTISDEADPERTPLPKPATLLANLPIGPVAVFGASNFPYAFSVAGGDTASALAAGCPVVVKGHPAHPATSELVASAISKALDICQLPQGVFSLLQTNEIEPSHLLVKHPAIKAVGFTGSYAVAKHLQNSINQRVEPIPLYGELGSVNPQVILPELAQQDGNSLAETLVQSLLMGQGQFCTSPGVWLLPESELNFIDHVASYIEKQSSAPLLTPGILSAYTKGVDRLSALEGVNIVGQSKTDVEFHATANLYLTSATSFANNPVLQEEVFGPFALIVTYRDNDELLSCVKALQGQLTASIHGTDKDLQDHVEVINKISFKVGRLIFNQMPTGVEVCDSMNHGGPFPASTDVRSTSVGSMAIKRYQRPICYQNMPAGLLD